MLTVAAALLLGQTGLADESLSGLADPTRPQIGVTEVQASPPAGTGPVLQATLVSPGLRRAIISGRSYTIGGRVDGAVIKDIHPFEVVLKQDGQETRLRLMPRLAKEPIVTEGKAVTKKAATGDAAR